MLKFLMFYIIGCYIVYKMITARNTKELKRMQKEERWSEMRIVINNILFPIINIIGVIILIFVMIPMTLDIPVVVTNNHSIYVGTVDSECSFFCKRQILHLNNDENTKLTLYFNDELEEDLIYKVSFLPRSKFGTKILDIIND